MVDSILVILQVNAPQTQQVQHHGVFIDVLRETNKQESLLQVLANAGDDKKLFKVDPSFFGVIEGSPWAYQLSENTFSMFKIAAERGRKLKCRAGISTGDDPRYLRLHFEVHSGSGRWMPIADGGQHERWYRPTKYVIDCESNFVRERNNLNESGQQRCAIRNIRFQGKPGITYLKNAGDRFAARVHHEGTFFLDTSRSTFPCSDEMLLMLGVLNTRCISWLLCLIGGGGSFVNTDVERLHLILRSSRIQNCQR